MSRVAHDQVRELTSLLRLKEGPFWSRLRDLLSQRDIHPQRAVFAECFPDDNSFEFGIIVKEDGSVFQFGFEYFKKAISDGTFSEWEDLTGRFQETPHRKSIEAALQLVKEEHAG